MRHSIHVTGIIAAMLLLASCGDDSGPVPETGGSVEISPDGITLLVGLSGQLGAMVTDANGDIVLGSTLSWSIESPSIATIVSDGTVTGEAVGVTQAIVSVGDLADTAIVYVVDQLSLEVEPADTAINVLETATYTVVATNSAGDPVPPPPVTWSSSNTSVATIDGSGVATGKGVGFTDIVATAGLVSSAPAVLQVNASAGQCYGIASAAGFQGNIAYGFKAVDQPTEGGSFVTADDNGSLHATMTQVNNGPFLAAWVGEVSGSSSASVTQKKTDGGTSVSTYTSTSGVMMPQPALGGLPKITLLVDLQQCTYRVVSGASLATLLTDQFGNQVASVDIVATIQFAGAVPQDWRNTGIGRSNGTMGGHSTVWGGLHQEADALMPLGFAVELFNQGDPEPPAGEASGGFHLEYLP